MPSEFDLIDDFLRPFGGGEGVGSDCASVRVTAGMRLVSTTDAVVQDVHFTLHRFTPALVRREGYDVRYVDVVDRARQHGQSHYGMWRRLGLGLLDLYGVFWLIHRRRRVPIVTEIKSDAS